MRDDEASDDLWLTVAEIADELRVNPATVRLWITKELLPAKRAGRRKLLVRRSDLDAMLRAQEDTASSPPPGPAERDEPLASVTRIHAEDDSPHPTADDPLVVWRELQIADEAWTQARDASQNAPPDPDFPHRLTALAHAATHQAHGLRHAAEIPRMKWKPTTNAREMVISHELRPGANRPGPPTLWAEFDRRVQRLGLAMDAPNVAIIAARWQDLADTLQEIADILLESLSDANHGAT